MDQDIDINADLDIYTKKYDPRVTEADWIATLHCENCGKANSILPDMTPAPYWDVCCKIASDGEAQTLCMDCEDEWRQAQEPKPAASEILAAAAPEMLAALQELRIVKCSICCGRGSWTISDSDGGHEANCTRCNGVGKIITGGCPAHVRDAIKKATGEGAFSDPRVADLMSRGLVDQPKQSKPWQSCAEWPEGTVKGTTDNITRDGHDTAGAAKVVCNMLEHYGFGSEGNFFPIKTWVEYDGKLIHAGGK